MNDTVLPLGKLPPALLEKLLARVPLEDPAVIVGPGVGMDCAVIEHGDELLVLKSDPVTFVTDELGHYLVQVNSNDIVTTGATPRWLLLTLLLPQNHTTPAQVEDLMHEISGACQAQSITLVGGHTEITHGLDRPLAVGTLIGTVSRNDLVTPKGARPGDRLLLTKWVPIEGACILARECAEHLQKALSEPEIRRANGYLHDPGISVVVDARTALSAGQVTAMHDPTEGGLLTALWELATASGQSLHVDPSRVPVDALATRICAAFGIDPMATIASGALLLSVDAADASTVIAALRQAGIACTDIGHVGDGASAVYNGAVSDEAATLPQPHRDELARVFEQIE